MAGSYYGVDNDTKPKRNFVDMTLEDYNQQTLDTQIAKLEQRIKIIYNSIRVLKKSNKAMMEKLNRLDRNLFVKKPKK